MDFFYFQKRNDIKSLSRALGIVRAFTECSRHPVIVCMDSIDDAQSFKRELGHRDDITVMHSLEGVDKYLTENDSLSQVAKWIDSEPWNAFYSIEPLGKCFRDTVLAKGLFFERTIRDRGVRFVHFGDSQSFRCLGALILERFAAHYRIPFFMCFNTPFKGRHMLYDNLCRTPSKEFIRYYLDRVNNSLGPSRYKEVLDYKLNYKNFLNEKLSRYFKEKRYKNNTVFNLRDSGLEYLLICKNLMKKKKFINSINKPVDSPFFLLLLNKTNNWQTQFAMPFWDDIDNIAHWVWKALPAGYSLVVKEHPQVSFPSDDRLGIYELSHKLPGFNYIDGTRDTWDLVNRSAGVVFNCSTSGVESICFGKNLVALGGGAVHFDFECSPVHKVYSPDEIAGALLKCLKFEPNENQILAYIDAMLEWSDESVVSNNSGDIDLPLDDDYPKRLGIYLYNSLIKKGLIN